MITFRLVRRISAFISLLALANLSALGGDLSCATRGYAAPAPAGVAASGPQARHEHAGHAAGHAEREERAAPVGNDEADPTPAPCETEAGRVCCHAMTSCGIAVVADTAVSGVTAADGGARLQRTRGRAPTSAIRIPDPPPPRG